MLYYKIYNKYHYAKVGIKLSGYVNILARGISRNVKDTTASHIAVRLKCNRIS